MYFINKLCCICLCKKSDLKSMFDVDNDGISHYKKFLSTLAESDFDEIEEHMRLICEECIVTLNMVYAFKEKYLRNKTIFMSYISKLQTFSKIRGILSVRLIDIKKGIKTEKPTIEIKREKEDMDVDSVNETLQSTSAEDFLSVPIKEEFMDHGDDHLTEEIDVKEETTQVYIKQEPTESQPVTEETLHFEEHFMDIPFVNCSTEIDPLVAEKEELLSDTEAPPDGSTSQADAISEAEINETNINSGENTDKNTSELAKDLKMHECKICQKKYSRKYVLNVHMRTHSDERPYGCDLCDKRFKRLEAYARHKNVHSGERPYSCNLCDKKFRQSGDRSRHMLTHSGERNHECDICKKTFYRKAALLEHVKTHSGEKPFQCEVCKRAFSRKHLMVTHLRVHSGERPYECKICMKKFPYAPTLQQHMRIHSGEKRYECKICKKKFRHWPSLAKHDLVHSGEKPFECHLCNKLFRESGSLNKHLRKHAHETQGGSTRRVKALAVEATIPTDESSVENLMKIVKARVACKNIDS